MGTVGKELLTSHRTPAPARGFAYGFRVFVSPAARARRRSYRTVTHRGEKRSPRTDSSLLAGGRIGGRRPRRRSCQNLREVASRTPDEGGLHHRSSSASGQSQRSGPVLRNNIGQGQGGLRRTKDWGEGYRAGLCLCAPRPSRRCGEISAIGERRRRRGLNFFLFG